MVSSAPLPQLAWHHPPEATRDYLGFLLSTGRAVVVPPLQVELAKQQANEQAARNEVARADLENFKKGWGYFLNTLE